jgi:hypothetical protein
MRSQIINNNNNNDDDDDDDDDEDDDDDDDNNNNNKSVSVQFVLHPISLLTVLPLVSFLIKSNLQRLVKWSDMKTNC